MTRKVLVTGGAGYVGSHACKALAGAGFTPVTYDNLERGFREAVKWGPLEEGDLGDRERLDAALRRHAPAAVLHFAAYANVGESVEAPERYYRNNVAGTLTLLEAMRAAGIGHLVFSSTCAVYGVPRHIPIGEEHPAEPINPYGAGKLMDERMLRDFGAAHGLRSVALRYFNAAGADPEGETGQMSRQATHLIPLVLDVAIGRSPEIRIHGDDYGTPDGTCIRDYVHVSDLAEAHVAALSGLLEGGESGVYNLGTGTGHSVREVIETARRVTGHAIPARAGPRRPGDPPELVAAAGRAQRALGWRPRRAPLEVQIADAWRWHRAYWNGEMEGRS